MKNKLLICIALCYAFHSFGQIPQASMPRLVRQGNFTKFLVDNKPYLILGAELGNSDASSPTYMKQVWPKLKLMNVNTVFAPVYWELMELKEGQFNFTLVDDLIKSARANQMKVVLLWFGSWKNSMSCYAPEWVKTDVRRFPRIKAENGIQQEIMTPFSKNNLEADKRAFVKLMLHLKQTDQQHTVIAIQVENEMGMLPDARSYDELANAAFNKAVPMELISYLQKNKDVLLPETKTVWQHNGYKTTGNWEDIFGQGLSTDELFTAWYFAAYANEVAIAGKAEYNLPMYVNAALNRPKVNPGAYPSGGPLPHLMDIWKAGAPAIDILAPDIYFPDFKHWADLYVRLGNPFFTPETTAGPDGAAKAFFTFGNYNALSFSPFSFESTQEPLKEPVGKAYKVLDQLTPLIVRYGQLDATRGFLLNKDSTMMQTQLGNYMLTVKHDFTFSRTPIPKDTWPVTGGLVIAVSADEFYVAGTGIIVTFEPLVPGKRAGILQVDEGYFKNSMWIPGRRMNGDQDHQGRHVRIPVNEYAIQHVKLYMY